MAISLEVKTYIETYKAPLKKELSYIKENNWVSEPNVYTRDKMHERQQLMTSRNLDKLIYFADISEDCREYKSVKSFMQIIVEMVELMFTREQLCEKKYDWFNYSEKFSDMSKESVDELIDAEMAFQSEIRDQVSKLKIKLKKLNLDGENTTLELPIRADVPLPFLLKERLEELFPEIKKFIDEREEKTK